MQSSMLKAITEDFGNGGTIDGDLTISGDLTVSGGGSLSFDEILEGTQVIDVTDTEAFLVRKNGDGGDVFLVDTTNSDVTIGGPTTITTAATDEKLSLKGSNTPYIRWYENTSAKAFIQWHTDGYLQFTNEEHSESFYLADNGVGIGTSSPSTMLDITASASGDATLQLDSSANTSGISQIRSDTDRPSDGGSMLRIQAYNQGTEAGAMYFIRGSADTKSDIAFNTSNSERMRIDEDGNVGIGLSTLDTPLDITPRLQVEGLNASTSSISAFRNSNDAHPPYLLLGKSRGTAVNADTIIQDNDVLGKIAFVGADGTDRHNSGAEIFARVDGTPGSNDLNGELVFGTTANGGTSPTERLNITATGEVYIGTDNEGLSINGNTSATGTITGVNRALSAYKSLAYNGLDHTFKVSGTNRMTISSAGMVTMQRSQADENLLLSMYSATDGHMPALLLRKSATNTLGTAAATGSGDVLGQIVFQGHDTDNDVKAGVIIRASADASPDGDSVPSKLQFMTSDLDDSGSPTVAMTIDDGQNVGIGTDSPAAELELVKDGGASEIFVTSYRNDAGQPNFAGRHARGSKASPAIVQDGDTLWQAQAYGYDGDGDFNSFAGGIQIQVDGTPGANDMPGRIRFLTTADGSGSWTERMRIDSSGRVGIGITPLATFHAKMASNVNFTTTANSSSLRLNAVNDAVDATIPLEINSTNTKFLSNTGIGATPVAMHTDYSLLQVGALGTIFSNTASGTDKSTYIGNNVFKHTDGTWDTIVNDEQALYEQHGGKHYFYTGAAHASVSSLATKFVIDTNSRISLSNNDSGTQNTVFGHSAGMNIDSGTNYNTFIGYVSAGGATLDDATNNTAVGYATLNALTQGDNNTALGTNALLSLNTGVSNTAIGSLAGDAITSTTNCTLVGYAAGGAINHTDATGTVCVGLNSGKSITSGQANTAIGTSALEDSTDSDYSTAVGYAALAQQAGTAGTVANTGIGSFSLGSITTGTHNIGLGSNTLYTATTALRNVAIGFNAMTDTKAATAVADCVAIGYEALKGNSSTTTTGVSGTVAIGKDALKLCVTGTQNTAIGFQAADGLTTGGYNTFVGYQVADGGTITGDENTAVGVTALQALTDGGQNTAMGVRAGLVMATGDKNVFIGKDAADSATACSSVIAIGHDAMHTASTSTNIDGTVAIGESALAALTSGARNLAVGFQALQHTATGTDNIAIGHNVMSDLDVAGNNANDSDHNIGIGSNSMSGTWTNAKSEANIAIGSNTLDGNMAGANYNIALGYTALSAITSGKANIGIGGYAGAATTTAVNNIAIGTNDDTSLGALQTNTVGSYCIAIGTGALGTANENDNDGTVAIGQEACAVQAGTGGAQYANAMTAVGHKALKILTTGKMNTAVGYQALDAVTTGHHNTAVGYLAASTVGTDRTGTTAIGSKALHQNNPAGTTDYSVAVGAEAGENQTTGYQNTFLGGNTNGNDASAVNQTAIGYNTTGQADNSVTLGNADVTAVYMAQDSGATVYCAGVNVTTGINFPDDASANPSADANTLDNYEEGTWTVGINGNSSVSLTTASQSGKYTKIGNMVFVSGTITVNSLNSASGNLYITGLPFTASSGTSQQGGAVLKASGLAITDDTSLTAEIEQNATIAYLQNWDVATGTSLLQASEFSADGSISFTMTYTV